jgi:hypothetical protein
MAAALPLPRLLPSGDSAITVEFSRNIDDAANRRVLALDRAIADAPVLGVTETVPTYRWAQRRGAGVSRSPMAARTASIWKTSRKR